MARTSFVVSGFRELERALAEDLPKATAKAVLKRAATNAMQRIELPAEANAPRQSGKLATSITTQAVKARRVSRTQYARSTGIEVATGPVGRPAGGNAAWQEFGTVKMPANPFMRPAFDANKEAVIGIVRDELAAEIGKATARIARKMKKAG